MDTPTRENPGIDVVAGMVRVMRGYEAVDRGSRRPTFVGAHDGPVLQIKPPTGQPILVALEGAVEIAQAILKAAEVPTGPEKAAHDELESMDFEPIPR